MRKLSESIFNAGVERNQGNEIKQEDIYHPKTKMELKTIICNEILKQGENVNLNMIDVSSITNMNYLMCDYKNVKSFDVSKWDVSKVNDMRCMFFNCFNLEKLDLSMWVVNKLKYTKDMFYNCPIKYIKKGNKLIKV